MAIAFTLTSTSVTVLVNYTPKVIASSHPNFKRVVDLLRNSKTTEEQIAPLLDIPAAIMAFTGGKVIVQNGKLYYSGYEVKTSLARKIMAFINAGDETLAAPLIAFLENVQQNPDPRAAADLYDWVEASGLPLTGDGHVLAWKAVTSDYRSIYAPHLTQFDHRIGKTVEEDRIRCDANPEETCSRGLHFCSAPYLKSYASGGHRVVVVKIHPRDVVAFPRDYGLQKGRACRYQVVGEVPFDQVATYYPQGQQVHRGFDTVVVQHNVPAQRNGKFAIGQTWKARNGQVVKITSISGKSRPTYPIDGDNGANFLISGAYYTDRQSSMDLITLVSDVA